MLFRSRIDGCTSARLPPGAKLSLWTRRRTLKRRLKASSASSSHRARSPNGSFVNFLETTGRRRRAGRLRGIQSLRTMTTRLFKRLLSFNRTPRVFYGWGRLPRHCVRYTRVALCFHEKRAVDSCVRHACRTTSHHTCRTQESPLVFMKKRRGLLRTTCVQIGRAHV